MARIDNTVINDIRNKADIVDIVGSYIPLTKKGQDYLAVCPFHDDHSPSMHVSPNKQIYKCFSCNAAGNVFTFVQNYEDVSFVEAVKIVADKIGYQLLGGIQNYSNNKFNKEKEIMDIISKVLAEASSEPDGDIPVGVSNRHIHLTKEDMEIVVKDIWVSQPFSKDRMGVTEPSLFVDSLIPYMIKQKIVKEEKKKGKTFYTLYEK